MSLFYVLKTEQQVLLNVCISRVMRVSHSYICEDSILPRCYAVSIGGHLPSLRLNIVLSRQHRRFHPEYEGNAIL